MKHFICFVVFKKHCQSQLNIAKEEPLKSLCMLLSPADYITAMVCSQGFQNKLFGNFTTFNKYCRESLDKRGRTWPNYCSLKPKRINFTILPRVFESLCGFVPKNIFDMLLIYEQTWSWHYLCPKSYSVIMQHWPFLISQITLDKPQILLSLILSYKTSIFCILVTPLFAICHFRTKVTLFRE